MGTLLFLPSRTSNNPEVAGGPNTSEAATSAIAATAPSAGGKLRSEGFRELSGKLVGKLATLYKEALDRASRVLKQFPKEAALMAAMKNPDKLVGYFAN